MSHIELNIVQRILPQEKIAFLEKIIALLDHEMIISCKALLLGGSFLNGNDFLDVDLMIVHPDVEPATSWLQILVVDNIKVEIFHHFTSSIESKLAFEYRSDMCGLAEFLSSSCDLVDRTTTRAEVIKYSEELKSTQRKTISRSLLATYMHSGLHSLQRSTVKSDKIALTIDLLNIYRQGYHQFRQQTTNKNLKHFFRMLTLEDKAKAQQLIQAFEEALAGNITKFVDLMKIWLDTEELVSVKNGTLKNGVFLGEQ